MQGPDDANTGVRRKLDERRRHANIVGARALWLTEHIDDFNLVVARPSGFAERSEIGECAYGISRTFRRIESESELAAAAHERITV